MNLLLITTKIKSDYPLLREPVARHPHVAAVLVILFIGNNKAHVLMTKRALHLKAHPGEISFPGGVMETEDEDLLDTALRETREEIGLKLSFDSVIGQLPMVHTLTGYEVTPFVAVLEDRPNLGSFSAEVEEVLHIPLAPLLSTHQRDVGYEPEKGMVVYLFKHHRIWGASAKILQQIEQLSVH
jgi:8-oxo-dGTP pyrophosphatase MutT (NUDIX family)